MDHLGGGATVGCEGCGPVLVMQHAASHGDEQLLHFGHESHPIQGADAAVGQGQVDGTARGDGVAAHVRHALVHYDLVAAAGQVDRKEAAGESRTEQGDGCFAHVTTSPSSISTKRNTSV